MGTQSSFVSLSHTEMRGSAAISLGLYHGTCSCSENGIADGGFTGSEAGFPFLGARLAV